MKYNIELDSDLRLTITFLPLRLGIAFDVSVQRQGTWYTKTRTLPIGTLIRKLTAEPDQIAISMLQESVGSEDGLPRSWRKLAGNQPRVKPNKSRIVLD